MKPHQFIHPGFTLNGLSYSIEELVNFVHDLAEIGAEYEVDLSEFLLNWFDESEVITVSTSGSTGEPKSVLLLKQHMIESAKATGSYLDLEVGVSALLCLSTGYIAGKMMVVRALTLGWTLHITAPSKDALVEYDNNYDFVAMVPYQVSNSISALDKVKKILIGGGVVSKQLEAKLQDVSSEIFVSYGMTETCTHVAIQRLNGANKQSFFQALPNIEFSTDSRGCLVIDAPKIAHEQVVTNDLVILQSSHSFTWLGRYDTIINTGGVKINPENVEATLAPYIKSPFFIASESDSILGERIILVVEKINTQIQSQVEVSSYSTMFSELGNYERPKKIYYVSKFIYTETGKIKRNEVLELLKKYKK